MKAPWTEVSTRWGHPWHRMCSYLGSFPPALARSFIEMLSEKGDIILDPFSGRGTTLLECRASGRIALASDLNPIAVALSRAKSVNVELDELKSRIRQLKKGYDSFLYLPMANVQKEDIRLIFHPEVLAQLCYLRKELLLSDDPCDHFIIGSILGIMHGSERQDGTSAYLSISMPNTFSMSPGYVKRFVETKRLNRVPRDVFEILSDKLDRLFNSGGISGEDAIVRSANAKKITEVEDFKPYAGRVKLIVTSPPYLDIVNYAKQNWIRNWFFKPHPDFANTEDLDDELTLERWNKFALESTKQMKSMLAPDGVIVFVVGDISRRTGSNISLAREYLQRIMHNQAFNFVGCFADVIQEGAKTTRIWKETKGKATDTDRIVILSDKTPVFRTESLKEVFQGVFDIGSLPSVDMKGLIDYAIEFSHVKST